MSEPAPNDTGGETSPADVLPRRKNRGFTRTDHTMRTGRFTRTDRIDAFIALISFLALGLPVIVDGPPRITGWDLVPTFGERAQTAALIACVAIPICVAFRRSLPSVSTTAIYVLALFHFWAGAHLLPVDLLILLSLYSVVMYGPVLSQGLGIAGAYVGALIVSIWSATLSFNVEPRPENGLYTFLGVGGAVTLTWAFAVSRRARLRELAALEAQNRALTEERDQQAELAATFERTRIAREMHDIVAHSLSVMIAQADGGRYAATTNPEAAVDALATISSVGRDALADMRKILGVLRHDSSDASPRLPQPVDADLDRLIQQVRGSGLKISLVRLGQARPLPPGAGTAIYRICQEALTNILKHAGPDAVATVILQWRRSSIDLRVEDDGRGAGANNDGRGHGLLGMQERATVFGGTLSAGPRPGGGFQVHVNLPVPPSTPTPATGVELGDQQAPTQEGRDE